MIDLRLGERMFASSRPCGACASARYAQVPALDDYGYHAMSCAVNVGSTRRHNALQDVLYNFLRQPPLCLNVARKWRFPSQSHLPECAQARMDIVIDDLRFQPRLFGIDVTVVSPHNAV